MTSVFYLLGSPELTMLQIVPLIMELTMCLQVLRWSALGLGVVYGAYHQMSLSAKDRAAHAQKEYDAKAKLISEAKAEFTRKNKPQSVTSAVKSEGKGFDCRFLSFILEMRSWTL
jgi:F-type H+-transporting ATP synthase subunit e